MNLSISNIGWTAENDGRIYGLMEKFGFTGLEIAPTRTFPKNPYENLSRAKGWMEKLNFRYGFTVSSMQSIWYGRPEKIFGSRHERDVLISYTKKAVDFAEAIGCGNLVFGCPKNRVIPEDGDRQIAMQFFKLLGDYAHAHHTVLAMEANPPIYHTNFMNTTDEAIDFVERVNSKGFLLNLDVGTMIANNEPVEILKGRENLINHVHISEPGLGPVQERRLHTQLAEMLWDIDYKKYVSIEVKCQENIAFLGEMMKYVSHAFC